MKAYLLALAFFTSCAAGAVCEWQNQPNVLAFSSQAYRYMVYEEPDSEAFWQTGPEKFRSVEDFRAWAKRQTQSVDPFVLLKRQRDIFARYYPDLVGNFEKVLNKEAGLVREMTCIEKLLFAEHTRTFPVTTVESEFRAFVLKHPVHGVKVYLGLSRVNDGVPPPFDSITALLPDDLENGYRLVYDIHSHPFFFKNPSGDIAGTTIPSSNDGVTFRNERALYGLQGALITNGFNTIELRADEFDVF